jgi:hypothetical protein
MKTTCREGARKPTPAPATEGLPYYTTRMINNEMLDTMISSMDPVQLILFERMGE